MTVCLLSAGAMCSYGSVIQHGADSAGQAHMVHCSGHAPCTCLPHPHARLGPPAAPHALKGQPMTPNHCVLDSSMKALKAALPSQAADS